MALPVPNLDDRRFQDLVDDAKRLVQQRCPEWTDHNVSDPGVTLIELFAWMTDQLLYRLNRVPDLHYVKFLELLGVTLFPPTAARGDVTFWLSAPRPGVVRIPEGTEVASPRAGTQEPITFTTVEELAIVPCSVTQLASVRADGKLHAWTRELERGGAAFCFSEVPQPGDAFLVGLSDNVPACAVALTFDCTIEGIGVDPENPPLAWEAWDGSQWAPCELERDETGGLNRSGDVVLHVPATHQASVVGAQFAGWLRCRVTEPKPGQPGYGASPEVRGATAFTIGGTVGAMHAKAVKGEAIGTSQGVPGQRFRLERQPVVPGGARVLEVGIDGRWEEWEEVTSFANSRPDDRHFTLDARVGEVALGPAVREPDGSIRTYGAVPPNGAVLRLRSYLTGGGPSGNVTPGVLTRLRTPIPFVSEDVVNRHAATGGVAGEEIENAKIRGPIVLRTGDRAVTMEDYEQLAREAAPELARVACVPAGDEQDAGGVRVLVVPSAAPSDTRLRFDELTPREEQVRRIARHLDERRVIGVRLVVEPPLYQAITVVARMRARREADPVRLQRDALRALYDFFDPIRGGPDGGGWPFGRPVLVGEAHALLQGLGGVDVVEDVRLFPAEPTTGRRGARVERLDLLPNSLVFSYEHRVVVEKD
jgi:predicted phage baseplate assembly protein